MDPLPTSLPMTNVALPFCSTAVTTREHSSCNTPTPSCDNEVISVSASEDTYPKTGIPPPTSTQLATPSPSRITSTQNVLATPSSSNSGESTSNSKEETKHRRKRLRATYACDRCFIKKIKCSGTRPCNNCFSECKDRETAEKGCSYARVTPRIRNSDYVKLLEEKLKILELQNMAMNIKLEGYEKLNATYREEIKTLIHQVKQLEAPAIACSGSSLEMIDCTKLNFNETNTNGKFGEGLFSPFLHSDLLSSTTLPTSTTTNTTPAQMSNPLLLSTQTKSDHSHLISNLFNLKVPIKPPVPMIPTAIDKLTNSLFPFNFPLALTPNSMPPTPISLDVNTGLKLPNNHHHSLSTMVPQPAVTSTKMPPTMPTSWPL